MVTLRLLGLIALLAFGPQDISARSLSFNDIQNFVDQLGDEILTHQSLGSASSGASGIHNLEHFDEEQEVR